MNVEPFSDGSYEKRYLMCNCDCDYDVIMSDESDENYLHCSNGVQSYAAPSAGPYIAATHVPSEFGPTYVA